MEEERKQEDKEAKIIADQINLIKHPSFSHYKTDHYIFEVGNQSSNNGFRKF